ncbi:MAG: phosphoribosylaminoimidazolesuccinocarboxamide synthase [Chitinophagales bacterium]
MAYHFPKQTQFYEGKVRDVYYIDNKYLVMIVSDRISAFDVVLPRPIPYKGQVLNQIAATFIKATEDIVPNWIINVPAPNISIGRMCEPFKVEMVIRGYLAGSAWRAYKSGIREICGVQLPEGLKENQKLETPIITPTTKASVGHDEEISKAEIIARNIVSNEDYEQLEKYTHQIFQRGTEIAAQQGLILVDTKYEFGKIGNEIYLIDEIHTPDSSRYFYADVYEENFKQNLPQKQLSKEFVREWLMENNFMGKVGQTVPNMTDEIVQMISDRYIELYETILGKKFIKQDNIDEEQIILQTLEQLDI